MIERDKEYYNQKISELYAVIENQEKIIRDLQEENKQLKEQIKEIEEYINDFIRHGSYGNDDADESIKQEFHNIMLIIKYAKAKGNDNNE
jgi:uncharacterized protein YlxW (UPF0749 family)